jgi:hypothetical protein
MDHVISQARWPFAPFGFDPAESLHHYLVNILRGSMQEIRISEHFTRDKLKGSSSVTLETGPDGQIRVRLRGLSGMSMPMMPAQSSTSRRIGKRTGLWRAGHNLVRRGLGKELVLLAWASRRRPCFSTRSSVAWRKR